MEMPHNEAVVNYFDYLMLSITLNHLQQKIKSLVRLDWHYPNISEKFVVLSGIYLKKYKRYNI